ncbi:MAG TPA: shikimate dehydrogenase [Phycisphaerales bacterium]|nr:shikimate dehydrogenase [Phycisphaerales bacterium]
MTYLAVPIAAKDVGVASLQINAASRAGAEMLELRVDYLETLNTGILKAYLGCARSVELPLIVTCRDKAQGGANEHRADLRVDVIVEAIKCQVDYVDCEYANFVKPDVRKRVEEALAESKTRLILSAHDFEGKFKDMAGLYDEIIEACPQAIPKLIYTATHINDCFEVFDLLRNKRTDAIAFCMGEAGLVSRILAKKLGSLVSFAAVDDENATAPGQICVEELKQRYRWDHIDAETEVYGVIGCPVGHSVSPAVFNACFDSDESNRLYVPLLVEGEQAEFNEFMANVVSRDDWLGFRGFSVTIPHKGHAAAYAERAGDFLESLAADIGAVNTLKVGFGGLVSGYNTDCGGAIDALAAAMGIGKHELHKVSVAVIGAGGVSRAVVAGLMDVGADVTVYNRTVEKAAGLAEEFKCKYAGLDKLCEMQADVVVNCTSIGMYPNVDASGLPEGCIREGMTVFDTVYNPVETLMLKQAKAKGARCVTGAEMFIRQAMAQYKIYTGAAGDENIMRRTIFDCIS